MHHKVVQWADHTVTLEASGEKLPSEFAKTCLSEKLQFLARGLGCQLGYAAGKGLGRQGLWVSDSY